LYISHSSPFPWYLCSHPKLSLEIFMYTLYSYVMLAW
jgi:hypothetical protein